MAKSSQTYDQAKRSAVQHLAKSGCVSAQFDARILLLAAADMDASDLIAQGEQIIPAPIKAKYESYIERRIRHEPAAYITGEKEFWSLMFKVSEHVLIPRPETEGAVELALKRLEDVKSPQILDVGTGSGAILISLLAERRDSHGLGVDISKAALEVAQENSVLNGVEQRCAFQVSNYMAAVDGAYDLIVSNPPYIDGDAMKALPLDVGFEPDLALAGGADGLAAYRAIVSDLPRVLKEGGVVVFEIGFDQGQAVSDLLRDAGLKDVQITLDLAGHDRIVSAKLSA